MQIFYLSNRPARLIETLTHVENYMSFITSAVVVGPSNQEREYGKLRDRFPVQFVDEQSLSDDINLDKLDHQTRNFLLRSRAIKGSLLDDEFIMSDDDARPLQPVELSFFISNGRYNAYYFYDLERWRYRYNAFDIGQHNTCQLLKFHGMPHLSYASHMPQIINRAFFREMVQLFEPAIQKHGICEWSSYFNHAVYTHPDRFNTPGPFCTLCWPEMPASWDYMTPPQTYCFENYSPQLYLDGAPFSGLQSAYTGQSQHSANIEKIMRWRQYELLCRDPMSWSDLSATPYTLWKKLSLLSLLPLKKVLRHVSR